MEKKSEPRKLVSLDGRTGEGGGQLVRIAVSLAALTGTPLQIHNVRANREGSRGGGLKAQHAACIGWLAEATAATVSGCSVGSKTVEFRPSLSPDRLANRNINIKAQSAASILLVFQAIFPFLLFAGDDIGSPIQVTIEGGTNVSYSPSFEYLDQVLLPSLERFGIKVDRRLAERGWSHGTPQIGVVKFQVFPLAPGHSLISPSWPLEGATASKIDISIIVPKTLQEPLKSSMLRAVGSVFPNAEANILLEEASNHRSRIYALVVAHTSNGLRFGSDWLYDKKTGTKTVEAISTEIAQRVVSDLSAEIRRGGLVDEYLQDQLIVFQALAEGRSMIPGSSEALASEKERVDRTEEPFGQGSTHTTTARWVTSQLLPNVKWIDKGRICEGVGWKVSQ